ncbi:MAG: hypothetical protein VX644_16400 [Planctomycetota bacterium]|nr:hypothetical protein [Planctomycetota bacterium]
MVNFAGSAALSGAASPTILAGCRCTPNLPGNLATQPRDTYTSSVSKYNQAQFRLLRAIGQFPQPTEEATATEE